MHRYPQDSSKYNNGAMKSNKETYQTDCLLHYRSELLVHFNKPHMKPCVTLDNSRMSKSYHNHQSMEWLSTNPNLLQTQPSKLVCSWYFVLVISLTLCKKATFHLVMTMLATSKYVLFPGHNHLLTTGTDDPSLWLLPECQRNRTC